MGACCTKQKPRENVRYVVQRETVRTNPLFGDTGDPAEPGQPAHLAQPTHIYFQHILEAIYDAAIKAQMNVQINNLHQLFWFFPQDGDGTHRARTVRLKVPCPEGGERVIDIPIFTLVHHKHLTIHELKLKTKLDMEMSVAPYEDEDAALHHIKKKKYHIELTPGDKSTDLEITMQLEEPMEVCQRILHKFESMI